MRMCSVKEISEGMVLGKSLYQANGKLLLGAGFRISQEVRTKLIDRNIPFIYIMEEGTDDVIPQDIITDEVRLQSSSALSDKATHIQKQFMFKNIGREHLFDMLKKGCLKDVNINRDMKIIVQEILNDISSAGVKFMNTVMYKAKDTYYFDHSINTTILAILIGKHYRFSQPELLDLALGAFLHDFGKIVVERLRETTSPAAVENLIREHPTFGYLILHNSRDTSPIVAQIVNQHHEFQDGTGYPIGLKGQNLPPLKTVQRDTKGTIYRLAEICCVANAFDNMVLSPHGAKLLSPAEAMKELIRGAGNRYNKDIVGVIHKVVPHFPVGACVRVKSSPNRMVVGFRGVVAKINENALDKPFIILVTDRTGNRIRPIGFDTAKEKGVELDLLM